MYKNIYVTLEAMICEWYVVNKNCYFNLCEDQKKPTNSNYLSYQQIYVLNIKETHITTHTLKTSFSTQCFVLLQFDHLVHDFLKSKQIYINMKVYNYWSLL